MKLTIVILSLLLAVTHAQAQNKKELFLEEEIEEKLAELQNHHPTRPPSITLRGGVASPTDAPFAPSTAPRRKMIRRPTALPGARGGAPSKQPIAKPSKAPTKRVTPPPSAAGAGPPTVTPSLTPPIASPSEISTASLTATASPTVSPFPTKEPTFSPSKIPSTSPTVTPSTGPSMPPTNEPTKVPSQQPSSPPSVSASPSTVPTFSLVPTTSPSWSPTNIPSYSPSAGPSSSPSESRSPTDSPSQQPSALPTTSSAPSFSPTFSTMPSMSPTFAPSSTPSSQPSESPTAKPTSSPTGQPSASPSNAPSQVPSEPPTNQPSAVPTLSFKPSVAPSQSMSPSESRFEELEAEIAVPVQSSTLMDDPTIAVFETTTLNFLKEHIETDTITITSVTVTGQVLEERRLSNNGGRDLQVTDLKVNILVKATRFVGNSTEPYSLEQSIERAFEQSYEEYASDLIDSSSFFRVGFRVEVPEDSDSSKGGSPLTGSTLIVVCAVAGCALFVLFSAFLVWRIHSRGSDRDPNRSTGLPSWKSQEISASSGYMSNESIESPTESDIYTRHSSRRSLYSDKDSQGSSQRSNLSERSDSPTVGSPYNVTEEKSIDTSFSNSDRCQPNPYSPFSLLAPIDENSHMTDIDQMTPRNGRTPRGSEFFEVQRSSAALTAELLSPKTPKHAKFEDCEVRSPKVAFVKSACTPKGTEFAQLNTVSAERTGSIIDDLTRFERAWDVQLDSKVNGVTETPKANNLEKYKKAPRRVLYGGSPDKGTYAKQ